MTRRRKEVWNKVCNPTRCLSGGHLCNPVVTQCRVTACFRLSTKWLPSAFRVPSMSESIVGRLMVGASEENCEKKDPEDTCDQGKRNYCMETCLSEHTSHKELVTEERGGRERLTEPVVVTMGQQQQGCVDVNLVLHGKPWHWNQTTLWGALWVSAQHRQVFNRQEEKMLLSPLLIFFFLFFPFMSCSGTCKRIVPSENQAISEMVQL